MISIIGRLATPSGNRTAARLRVVVAGLLLVFPWSTAKAFAQQPMRTLSGNVTDLQHEPLKGAIVELVNVKTESVVSYLTDKSGHYIFKRVEPGTDYQFFATYRGHRSKMKKLGIFDSKTAVEADFAIKLR